MALMGVVDQCYVPVRATCQGSRVRAAQRSLEDRQCAGIQTGGLGVCAGTGNDGRETVQGDAHLVVVRAEHVLEDGQRLAECLAGFGMPAAGLEDRGMRRPIGRRFQR